MNKHIWLPYTQMKMEQHLLDVKSAHGARIVVGKDNTELIDCISSWWSMIHGYQHPEIVNAMVEQTKKLSHVMFAGNTHESAEKLADLLVEKVTPKSLNKVFFSDSGSIAVEVAMKIAVQYHCNIGDKNKTKFICFKDGYHGDTMATMSISGRDSFHGTVFEEYIPQQHCLKLPRTKDEMQNFSDELHRLKNNTAALIIEPLVQGAGGMKFHSPETLKSIFNIAKSHEILVIFDEIATGFLKTGKMLACDHDNLTPDILCLGKAITGGMCSMGVTIAQEYIFDAFLSDHLSNALMHGTTFMANPVTCAAAYAAIHLSLQQNSQDRAQEINAVLKSKLKNTKISNNIIDIRIMGIIGVIECKELSFELLCKIRTISPNHGIFLRPFGNIIYIIPPLVITNQELTYCIDIIKIHILPIISTS